MSKTKPKNDLAAFIQQITTVHGTSHFSSLKGRSLRLWSFMMVANMLFTIAFIMVIKEKFNENQIVTQINANCKVSQVPFPAVSICNFNLVSLRESANVAFLLRNNSRPEQEIQSFFNALPRLKDYNKDSRDVDKFTDIMTILKQHYYTIDSVMEEVHQKCENLLLSCSFNHKDMKCNDIFRLIKTYEGYCCAFNYAALNDGNEEPLLPDDSGLEFYDDQNEAGMTQTSTIISTSEAGSSSGLRVVINVEPDDYPPWSTLPYYGAKIMITDPNDYPETTMLYRYISPGDSVDIKVEAMVFQSELELRRVSHEKRGCLFYDEVVLEHTDRYSFETCYTECRMKTYFESCGCIPYKYPKDKSIPVCEFKDLRCLNNVTVFKSNQEMNCKPVCFQECRDKKYRITSNLLPFNVMGVRESDNIIKQYNASQLSEFEVFFAKSNCNCYKMMLLIDANYFIATYGGVFSLFFGGSVLTLFELVYLVLSATVNAVRKKVNDNIKNKTTKS